MEYPPRVYDFSLHTVGLILGFLLLVIHLIALVRPEQTKGWLLQLPRSKPLGIGLLAVVSLWTFWLVSNMDLGEFSQYRTWLQIGVPVAFVLTVTFVDEFLAVRGICVEPCTRRQNFDSRWFWNLLGLYSQPTTNASRWGREASGAERIPAPELQTR